ncbi:stage II sporulation protein M [Natrialbaceae archaeon A-arb3/5]
MSLSDSVGAVVSVFRNRPGDLLPLYLLGAAIPAIVRVAPFAAAVVAYLYLETTGRLEELPAQLAEIDTTPPDSDASEEAFEAWLSQFDPIVEQLVTPTTVLLFVSAFLASLLVLVILYVVLSAGQLATCDARLRDERGLTAGIAGVRRYSLRFFALAVFEFVLWMLVLFTIGGAAIFVAIFLTFASPVLSLLVLLFAIPVVAIVLAVIRAVFAFAPVSVVVDDAGVFGSLSKTLGFIRARPIDAGFYYVMSIGTTMALMTVSGVLFLVDVTTVPSLVSVLLLLPAFDLLKTALYSNYRDRLRPPSSPERRLRTQFRDGLRRGWSEMTSYVRRTPGTHALVIVLALGSFWVGWRLADPYAAIIDTSIAARLEGHIPPTTALEFFGNNWLVAITTAYAGVALVVPALASLLFNGVYMGVIARLEVEPIELLAFVIPHGIFEIPAIFIASALGLSLGAVSWRAFRGRIDRTAFADSLERAFWVLVGIGILLAVAAVIEGFVSPYYYRLFL